MQQYQRRESVAKRVLGKSWKNQQFRNYFHRLLLQPYNMVESVLTSECGGTSIKITIHLGNSQVDVGLLYVSG